MGLISIVFHEYDSPDASITSLSGEETEAHDESFDHQHKDSKIPLGESILERTHVGRSLRVGLNLSPTLLALKPWAVHWLILSLVCLVCKMGTMSVLYRFAVGSIAQ